MVGKPIVRLYVEIALRPFSIIHHAAMADHHAFWQAGRSGRIKHIGKIIQRVLICDWSIFFGSREIVGDHYKRHNLQWFDQLPGHRLGALVTEEEVAFGLFEDKTVTVGRRFHI